MRLGILGTIQLAATLIFAAPVGIFGVTRLVEGDTLIGGGAVAIAAAMVLLPHYLTTPTDIPMKVGERVVSAVVKEPDDDEAS
ncbi:DUF7533 family protein [Halobellus captivus]|uniref:DUF7533 family protein n=1 Tax=Halobellus captivus TaxID=2592614 RepID=UPI00119FAAFD|nr:hypothetical protein [Halobellus captivus]